jgi:hypothetical protein
MAESIARDRSDRDYGKFANMRGDGDVWHIVEAKRDDGTPTTFQIRELDPKKHLDRIFVVEMPYPTHEMSRLPDAAAYRKLQRFEEQWLDPALAALGWELVGSKTEDGSFFLYMYGATDPEQLMNKLAPFDAALGFFDDHDPEWTEYATLRELLDQARAMPRYDPEPWRAPRKKPKRKAKPKAKPKAKAKTKPGTRSRKKNPTKRARAK